MEEALWSLAQQSRVLQDLRKDNRSVWNDEAAREINSRYLDPHEIDSQQMLAALGQQQNSLDLIDAKLKEAQADAQQADAYARVVIDKLKFVEQDITNAFSHYDLFVKYNSDARSKFPRVYELIHHANNACG
ncbi:MAG TPA: hypothetical protein VJ464_28510 [Blastocatellia bacterium]|nr:hypothetical protein [Blastocatellia bacterium]